MNHSFSKVLLFIFLSSQITFSQLGGLEATFRLIDVNGTKIPYQNNMEVPSFEKQKREIIQLSGNWKKQRFAANDNITMGKRDSAGYSSVLAEAAGRHLKDFNDAAWTNKNIPSVENTINSYPTVPEFYEDGVWYRYKFNVSDSLKDKFIKLIFYSVNYVADVWINGNYLGWHEGGYTPFAFDASKHLSFGQENTIAVRIDNPKWGSRKDIVPYVVADWFNYTGIIHDVYLEVSEKVSTIRADVVPLSTEGELKTTIIAANKSGVAKNIKLKLNVFESNINSENISTDSSFTLAGNEVLVEGLTEFSTIADSILVWKPNLKINSPKLWSPLSPNLYLLKVTVEENGSIVDEYFTQFGIRSIGLNGNKVLLNNKSVFFTGTARHEDHPVYGRSIPKSIIYNDLKLIKETNCNILRTAHYPNNPYTYLVADRLGITIIEEIPVWWFDEAIAWQYQSLRKISDQMFREMVFKDYNRPSILFWSTSNECLDVNNRSAFIQRVKQDLTDNFNDTRLITESAAADRPGANDPSQSKCDVAGWTMYFGVFHGGTYYDGTKNFLTSVKSAFPNKPVLNTEFGYWSSENGSTTNVQVNVFQQTFKALSERGNLLVNSSENPNGNLAATIWWCFFDWYTAQHPNGFQSMGLYNMQRTIAKPVASTLKTGYLPYFSKGGVLGLNDENTNSFEVKNFELFQNYPNPFNPTTSIEYYLPSSGNISVSIYNITGELVVNLFSGFERQGLHSKIFNTSLLNLSSGAYFCTIETPQVKETIKMILLK